MENLETLMKHAEKVDIGRYDIGVDVLLDLAKKHRNNLINGSFDLFRIGFLKGQRAEKARQRRKNHE